MTGKRPRILGLAVHPPQLAATRLRVTEYFEYFEDGGFSCGLWTFLSGKDLPRWYGASTLGRLRVVVRAMLRVPRAVALIRAADVVVVQRECIPFGPPWLEWIASRWARLVWDVDDFVWRSYESPTAGVVTRWLRTSEKKHERICGWADDVWAGSAAIAEWAATRNSRIEYVPTTVRVPERRPSRLRSATAVWIGSHSTTQFLEQILPTVARCEGLQEVRAVGATFSAEWPAKVKEMPWSTEVERDAVETGMIGLYPVDRANVYAEGKCGLKAILYMAHGLPSVVTPTGPNAAIVRDGVDGLHAESDDDWGEAIDRLLADDELWERCSAAGYERASREYSLQTWGPRLLERVRDLASTPMTCDAR